MKLSSKDIKEEDLITDSLEDQIFILVGRCNPINKDMLGEIGKPKTGNPFFNKTTNLILNMTSDSCEEWLIDSFEDWSLYAIDFSYATTLLDNWTINTDIYFDESDRIPSKVVLRKINSSLISKDKKIYRIYKGEINRFFEKNEDCIINFNKQEEIKKLITSNNKSYSLDFTEIFSLENQISIQLSNYSNIDDLFEVYRGKYSKDIPNQIVYDKMIHDLDNNNRYISEDGVIYQIKIEEVLYKVTTNISLDLIPIKFPA